MKRIFGILFVLLLLLAALAYGLVRFVSPERELDLSYPRISIPDKAAQLLLDRKPELVLTEQDINTLAKSELSRRPQVRPDVRVTGADFRLDGSLLLADVNLLYKDQLPVGVTAVYRLAWEAPELVASFDHAEIKGRRLPGGWLDPGELRVNLEEQLPGYVGIAGVEFPGDQVRVRFHFESPLR
ncbi:hypothetical protein J31TS4_45250 [Paenibacillus sp. J31TS4]|uniref:hypothetical protein n=1 Tax=Paenibacillus sp. J31TS4 TaxID=2807195 RepID=UPI001B292ED0|nr:hypothetical protein [Paenibacillus sp. J31TS4]GIP41245.1 hypothetical protein J31TS4_45250 [Paenibacillus sp. J31TS4]